MVFTSLSFILLYFPIVVILRVLIRNIKVQNLILLILSLLFYMWGEPKYIIILVFSIIFNYIFAIFIDKTKSFLLRKILFIIALIINIGQLIFFKYSNFIIININRLLHTSYSLIDIVLPIGISFYTFQILSYLIDVYNNKIKVQNNLVTLGTYITLFPQLVAGPIVRYSTIQEELENRKINIDDLYNGAKRFVIGLAKKVLIANQMALITDTIYSDLVNTNSLYMWLASLAYMFQIYYDFSGYSDMAIGIGKMLGFHFDENFNYPYMANSITDFWRRWHISLSTWFKEYVYIPLGGNRKGLYRQILNIMIVWILTGLWHGASWNFVIWGLYFGIILIFEKMFIKKPNGIYRLFTLFFIFVGWIIFRVDGISQISIVFEKLIDINILHIGESFSLYPSLYFPIIIFIPAIFFSFKHKYIRLPKFVEDLFILAIFVLSIVSIISSSYNPFIYFRF